MKTKHILDFSLLEKAPPSLMCSEALIERLSQMPETFARARAALMFLQHAEKQEESWRSAAFVRSALAEICAMQEMQGIDRPCAAVMKISDQRNPLLHLVALLRHLNIHVKATEVASTSLPITFNGLSVSFNGKPVTWTVLAITNLCSDDLARVHNSKFYDVSDLDRCRNLFDRHQLSHGVVNVISGCVLDFANSICDHHGL